MPAEPITQPDDTLRTDTGKVFAIFLSGFLAVAVTLLIVQQLGAPAGIIGAVFVAVSLAAYALLGCSLRASTSSDFFVADRSATAGHSGMALAARWTSISMILALPGTLYAFGFDGLAFLIGPVAGLMVMSVLFVPALRKSGAETVPEFLGLRFGRGARLIAVVAVALATFALLVAQIYGMGLVVGRFVDLPPACLVGTLTVVLLISVLPGGMKGTTWTELAQYSIVLLAIIGVAGALALEFTGSPWPPYAYGEALRAITDVETRLIEAGLASASTLKPHLAPFLQLDPLNFAGVIVTLMLGTACLPHLLMRSVSVPTVREARVSLAWAGFFVLLVAAAVPAIAAFTKLQIYRQIEQGLSFASLPAWIERGSRHDLVRIHGVSVGQLAAAEAAVAAGTADAAGVASHMRSTSPVLATGFAELKEPVKVAIVDAARSAAGAGNDPSGSRRWQAFQTSVLPAAAKAANNKLGAVTEPGLWIDPLGLMLVVPSLPGMPQLMPALIVAGILAAGLATAGGVLLALAHSLSHDLHVTVFGEPAKDERRLRTARLMVVAIAVAAAAVAVLRPVGVFTFAAWTFSLAAAGLFPALILAIWWKRATAAGAVAGMVAGLALALAYLVGTHFFPVAFHDLWPGLSSASDAAMRKFTSLSSVWSAAGEDAKAAAFANLEAYARGTATTPGVANWFGILNTSAALFAVPAGFVVAILVSLVTPRPTPAVGTLVDDLRRPKGPDLLRFEPSSER
ncbi:MAG: VC_2705 family sodium/solute symporter [Hyphomicrobium sp.]